MRSLRWALACCVILGAAALVPARADASARRCRLSQLKVVFAATEGAAGTIYNKFTVTNQADSCHLRGYFDVRLLDRSGNALPTHEHKAGASPDAAPHQSKTVVLRPDGRARFTVSYSDVCRRRQAVRARKLRLTPPHAASSVVLPAHPRGQRTDFVPCHGRLNVYRVFKRKAA